MDARAVGTAHPTSFISLSLALDTSAAGAILSVVVRVEPTSARHVKPKPFRNCKLKVFVSSKEWLMVRSSISTTPSAQDPHTVTVTSPSDRCGHCLETLTAADFDCLYNLLMVLRQHLSAACKPGKEDGHDESPRPQRMPLISLGPSGLSGPYQTEL
jgi:hypothetical protein